MMHKIIKLLKGRQSGQALVLALALLGIGSLMIAPMLSFMGTGLNAGVIAEDKTDELYACDAGVQDAIWQINHLDEPGAIAYTELDGTDDITGDYPVEEVYNYAEEGRALPHVNGMDVDVEITHLYLTSDGWPVYRIRTWVGGTVIDNSTMVDAIVTTTWNDYTGITNHVVTSQSDYEIDDKVDVTPPGEYDPDTNPNGARGDYDGAWPTPQALIDWYSRDVDKDNPYPDEVIDLDGEDKYIGPIYRDGDLTIINSDNTPATLYLTGTIYVTGDITFATTKNEFFVDLDGDYIDPNDSVPQTIFSESQSGIDDSKVAIEIDGRCDMTGSGCVIAVGNIIFKPHMLADPTDYILVLSIIGETTMYPSGDFYGTLAGSVHVDVKAGETPSINWNGPPPNLNFPGSGGGAGMIWGIHTWSYWTIWGTF